MNEQKVFAKSLLSAYTLIDNYCDALNKQVYGRSIASSGLTATVFEDTFKTAEGIIDLIGRKIALINLKVKIEKAVTAINKEDSKILILKYVDNLPAFQVAELVGMSQRNLFRRLNNALYEFCNNLKLIGITRSTFATEYANERWIFNIISRIEKEEQIKSAPKVPSHQMFA